MATGVSPASGQATRYPWPHHVRRDETVPEEREPLIAAFADGPRQLRAALRLVNQERLRVRPLPTKWSALEIALHVCDTEISVAFRLKRAIAEPGSPVPAFDQDRWVDALSQVQDLALALAAFTALREEMAALLRKLPAKAWANTSVHPEAGPVRLDDWLKRFVRHTESHISQILALSHGDPAADR